LFTFYSQMRAANLSARFSPFTIDECAQFSLENDDNLMPPTSAGREDAQREQLLAASRIRLGPTATNGVQRTHGDNNRTPNGWRDKGPDENNREASRLTDEIELDGDSASDDLDLLPPLNPTTATGRRRKLQKLMRCCAPQWVPPRCAIM
jgi:hypothetical protein